MHQQQKGRVGIFLEAVIDLWRQLDGSECRQLSTDLACGSRIRICSALWIWTVPGRGIADLRICALEPRECKQLGKLNSVSGASAQCIYLRLERSGT